eukprot:1140507-Prymnesium_polylepis.2
MRDFPPDDLCAAFGPSSSAPACPKRHDRRQPLASTTMDKFQCVHPLARTPSVDATSHLLRAPSARRRIEQQISQSANSVVHKARIKHTLEFVAIKSTPKSMRQQLMEEIRLLLAADHENVVRFHSWYETGNHLWVVSEYCAGGSVRQLLEQDGALPESTVLSLGLDVLAALERVHAEAYALVQIEPEAVLMTEYGIAKLARFRRARQFGVALSDEEVRPTNPAGRAPPR